MRKTANPKTAKAALVIPLNVTRHAKKTNGNSRCTSRANQLRDRLLRDFLRSRLVTSVMYTPKKCPVPTVQSYGTKEQ